MERGRCGSGSTSCAAGLKGPLESLLFFSSVYASASCSRGGKRGVRQCAAGVPDGAFVIGLVMVKPRETIDTLHTQYVCNFRPNPDRGYSVRCSAFRELVTNGKTLEEARAQAREALELCVEVYRDKGWDLPPPDAEPKGTVKELVAVKLAVAFAATRDDR
jgi:predicted RNase H-like HicB family nuclease